MQEKRGVRHSWKLTPGEARAMQMKLCDRVELEDRFPRTRTMADVGRRPLRCGGEAWPPTRLAETLAGAKGLFSTSKPRLQFFAGNILRAV